VKPKPPARARRFLTWYCRMDVLEEVQGDLDEAFEVDVDAFGARRARIRYWKEVLLFVRCHTVRGRTARASFRPAMTLNHAPCASRN